MKIIFEATPQEIAALVAALQERPVIEMDYKKLAEFIIAPSATKATCDTAEAQSKDFAEDT